MKLKVFITSLFMVTVGVASAHADNFRNCNYYKGLLGNVKTIQLGADNDNTFAISFLLNVDGLPMRPISVVHDLNSPAGRGMYKLLLMALEDKKQFRILRCYNDSVDAADII